MIELLAAAFLALMQDTGAQDDDDAPFSLVPS